MRIQMEEDLKGYLEWLTVAEDMGALDRGYHGGRGGGGGGRLGVPNANDLRKPSIIIDAGKQGKDPVVMGLLKSTMVPLQQVLEGEGRA